MEQHVWQVRAAQLSQNPQPYPCRKSCPHPNSGFQRRDCPMVLGALRRDDPSPKPYATDRSFCPTKCCKIGSPPPPHTSSPPPTSEAGPAPLDFGPRDIKAHVGTTASQLSFGAWAAPRGAQLRPRPVLLHGGEERHQC